VAGDGLELVYLTLEDALELYTAIVEVTTSRAAAALRSRSSLEDALARPASYARYQDADIALQAAVLAHGIAETQPFLDGTSGSRSSPCSPSSGPTAIESTPPILSWPTGSSLSAATWRPNSWRNESAGA
jgi:hypothetical protein